LRSALLAAPATAWRRAPLGGDLEQGQAQQGEGGGVDQRASEPQRPGGIEQLQREQDGRHQGSEEHKEHQRHHAQARGGEERGSVGSAGIGAWGPGRSQGTERRAGIAVHGGHKKAPPRAGPGSHVRAAIKPGAE
jgi:hypothetical protein